MTTRKLISRTIQILIVLIGISYFTFLLTYLAPGDPVRAMYLASGSIPSDEVIENTREEMGLNRPFLVQYASWLKGILHGDFGTSYSISYGRPVAAMLKERLWPTLKLSLFSMILMLLFAIPLGMLSAVKQNSRVDYLVRGVTFFGVSFPGFWVGLVLIYVVALRLGWLPVISSGTGFRNLILPSVTLAFSMSAKYTRQVRAAVLEELHKDYTTGLRARGMRPGAILWKHVFPNSLLPLVTLLGLSLGSLLGGTAVVEMIFSYPGLGSLAIQAVKAMDYPVIQGYVLWIALIYMVINLIVDMSYGILDPRMKRGDAK